MGICECNRTHLSYIQNLILSQRNMAQHHYHYRELYFHRIQPRIMEPHPRLPLLSSAFDVKFPVAACDCVDSCTLLCNIENNQIQIITEYKSNFSKIQ